MELQAIVSALVVFIILHEWFVEKKRPVSSTLPVCLSKYLWSFPFIAIYRISKTIFIYCVCSWVGLTLSCRLAKPTWRLAIYVNVILNSLVGCCRDLSEAVTTGKGWMSALIGLGHISDVTNQLPTENSIRVNTCELGSNRCSKQHRFLWGCFNLMLAALFKRGMISFLPHLKLGDAILEANHLSGVGLWRDEVMSRTYCHTCVNHSVGSIQVYVSSNFFM